MGKELQFPSSNSFITKIVTQRVAYYMTITLTTPAFLFPAVTFLLIAYTNRFLALGARIRLLHDRYLESSKDSLIDQIISLRKRMLLIRYMQAFGVTGLLLCVSCIFVLFGGFVAVGNVLFGLSLMFFLISLVLSLREIHLSVDALNFELRDIEDIIQQRLERK